MNTQFVVQVLNALILPMLKRLTIFRHSMTDDEEEDEDDGDVDPS